MQHRIRPFLKWPGGKFRLVERISATLPMGKQLIEPFLGGAAVFLNTHFEHYLLNDSNRDLITLYQILQREGPDFIKECRRFFTDKWNTEKSYYRLREKFNVSKDESERASLFLYLNRHGYNGLCRYNAYKGEFNVPFGRYTKPYFPEKEMILFHGKSKNVTFLCEDFKVTMKRAKKNSVVYCDPPYAPLSNTARFTQYQAAGFSLEDQETLAKLAEGLSRKGIPVLLSNHSNAFTQHAYRGAKIEEFSVRRSISCNIEKRDKVMELLALYSFN